MCGISEYVVCVCISAYVVCVFISTVAIYLIHNYYFVTLFLVVLREMCLLHSI